MNKKLYLQLILYPIILVIISSLFITSYHIYEFIKTERDSILKIKNHYSTFELEKLYIKLDKTKEELNKDELIIYNKLDLETFKKGIKIQLEEMKQKSDKEIKLARIKRDDGIKTEVVSTVIVMLVLIFLMTLLLYLNMRRVTKMLKEKEDVINSLNNSLQKKVESQIEEIRIKDLILAQKSKSEALGNMLSIITHQWRQPLNAINSITAKIYKDTKIGNLNIIEVQDDIDQIEDLTKYLSNTITDFSNFYKPTKKKEKFLVYEVIQNSLDILFPKYYQFVKPKIKFTYDENIILFAYKSQIQQIFLLILNNSIENFKIKNIKDPKIELLEEPNNEIGDMAKAVNKNII